MLYENKHGLTLPFAAHGGISFCEHLHFDRNQVEMSAEYYSNSFDLKFIFNPAGRIKMDRPESQVKHKQVNAVNTSFFLLGHVIIQQFTCMYRCSAQINQTHKGGL